MTWQNCPVPTLGAGHAVDAVQLIFLGWKSNTAFFFNQLYRLVC